jgi:NAD(P)-dependent dehydrogenase (short-subunit alcohol dehydrogenase family)
MKIIVIGATGTIGREVARLLETNHEVVKVGHTGGDLRVDIAEKASIEKLFKAVGKFDAVVSTAGVAPFGPFSELTDRDFALGLANKLMGQVNLVRVGRSHISDNGSFTLTAGMLARHPVPGGALLSIVNAGIEAFVRAAAIEMDRGIRVNAVSPPFLRETLEAMGMDRSKGIPAPNVAPAYRESVEGTHNGSVLDPRDFVPVAPA